MVDLFKVKLATREFPYALTKDFSKFYQKVQIDEITLELRRVIWRSGKLERDLDIYVITSVNFGDQPASCIAIATTWETARRFGEDKRNAAWSLTERTYVDDATPAQTAGSNCQE